MPGAIAFKEGALPVFQKAGQYIGHIVLKRIFGRNLTKTYFEISLI
jgi:hypothetical protein